MGSCYIAQGDQLCALCSVTTYRDGMGRGGEREAQEGGDIGIHIADSLCCTAETNTAL